MLPTLTTEDLAVAGAIDALAIGDGIEFNYDIFVRRVSPTRFAIDGKEMCFIEACLCAIGQPDRHRLANRDLPRFG